MGVKEGGRFPLLPTKTFKKKSHLIQLSKGKRGNMASIFLSNPDYSKLAEALGISIGAVTVLITIILVWTIIWKGLALWKSARKGSPVWFIVFLLVNTVGILPILYIYVFSKIKLSKTTVKTKKPVKKASKKKKK
tara:strand:+ start:610 stop:1014 length:405 start_codon:yes stop_codon:yes gene_type:complete